jgi:L-seryl-tRNA(Ser) seleniumtransferase
MREKLQDNSLRHLPAVDMVLRDDRIQTLLSWYARVLVTDTIREVLDRLRTELVQVPIQSQDPGGTGERRTILNRVVDEVTIGVRQKTQFSLRPVINATGVVLHTNLGRACLGEGARTVLQQVGGNYSNLELDLVTGERGSRYAHTEWLLRQLTGAEASLVVNNNAAAVLLALNTLARDREVIVSRGQLVEIGGSFRVPEVMSQSGAVLREVGTTNKTYRRDYAQAINDQTALLLKVHTSNYRIIGFTQETALEEIVSLGRERGLPVMEDLGSGLLLDLQNWGLPAEPLIQDSIRVGADIVTFSGDKLLGGPQAGIIVGKKQYLDQMKKNPLLRALRIDKLTLAALEATLREYLNPNRALETIPTLRMLTISQEQLRQKADQLLVRIRESIGEGRLELNVLPGQSVVGGGSMPGQELPTWLVTVRAKAISAAALAKALRCQPDPVLVRIHDEQVILDVRTINEAEYDRLVAAIAASLEEGTTPNNDIIIDP